MSAPPHQLSLTQLSELLYLSLSELSLGLGLPQSYASLKPSDRGVGARANPMGEEKSMHKRAFLAAVIVVIAVLGIGVMVRPMTIAHAAQPGHYFGTVTFPDY